MEATNCPDWTLPLHPFGLRCVPSARPTLPGPHALMAGQLPVHEHYLKYRISEMTSGSSSLFYLLS